MCRGMVVGVLADRRLRELEDGFVRQSGFSGFARALPEERGRVGGLHFAAAVGRGVGDERAQSLAPVDDAVALEFLVRALHGDDADEQILGQPPERGQRRADLETAFADFALQAVDDLQVQRPARRRRERGDQQPRGGPARASSTYCIY